MTENRIRWRTTLLFSISLVVMGCGGEHPQNEETGASEESPSVAKPIVAYVDGVPIERDEFEDSLGLQRAAVYQYFQMHHGVGDQPTFWESWFDGERPLDVLKKRTLDLLIRRKVQQGILRDHGVQRDFASAAFATRWQDENQRRARSDIRTYGPRQYSADNFRTYELENDIQEVEAQLAEATQLTSDDIEAQYQREKDTLFRRRITCVAEKYVAPTQAEAQAIRELLAQGQGETAIARQVPRLHMSIERYTTATRQYPLNEDAAVALSLRPSEVSRVIIQPNSDSVVLIAKNRSIDYIPLDEATGTIVRMHGAEVFERMVEDRIKSARIEIVDSVYASIKANT